MHKSDQIDNEAINYDQSEPSSLSLIAKVFNEIAIGREQFDFIREQTWRQSTFDEMLALALASSIRENCLKGIGGFSVKDFHGLCNTVRFLYDFKHARFDGESYWFSPDKNILARLNKYHIK
ncbi:MAG: hypothetical protein AAGU27_08345 [Dehalobacterium sp.]